MLYPLKFHPIIKQTLWGGEKLASKSNTVKTSIGESWELSSVQDNISIVSEGILAENTLEELIEVYMGDLVGDKVYEKFGLEFPLLIKYIDAKDDLSIQVHPDDKIAKERHNAYGKTEMWYIIGADKNASLLLGFNKDCDKGEYLTKLQNGTLTDILKKEEVKENDCFFIPAGTVHAICKGCFLAEIQQTSDITYRIFDYNRKGKDGKTRELHTELAVDVINYRKQEGLRILPHGQINHANELVSSDYFTAKQITFNKEVERDYYTLDSFVVYMCLEGEFKLIYNTNQFIQVNSGETILLPAIFKQVSFIPESPSSLLEIYIK